MARYDKVITKGQAQAAGMLELGSNLTQGAPFTADQIAQASTDLETLRNQVQATKDSLRSLTQRCVASARGLRESVGRNVCFFQGKLGKADPRLPKVGGRVLVHRSGLHREKKSGSATQDVKAKA